MCRFGLVLLAAVALGTVGVTPASAFVSGHFVFDQHHTELKGVESGSDKTRFKIGGLTSFHCEETSYLATVAATTVQEVTVFPTYAKCFRTKNETETEPAEVKTNGCHFIVKMGPALEEFHGTGQLACPVGKKMEINTPSGQCPLKIGAQVVNGLDYTTTTEFGKHALTVEVTIKGIAIEAHSICGILGTNSTVGELVGSVRVNAFSPFTGEPVNVTATGGEGPARFRSEVAHTTLTGSQSAENTYTFGILMGSVKCATTSVSGTMSAAATEEITLAPTYGGCKGLERDVTVDMNGCAYVLKAAISGGTASFVIECPAEKSIETTYDSFAGGCTVTVGAQTASGNVDLKNEGAGASRDILLTWTATGLKYKRDGCEVGGEASNGTYAGSVTLKGRTTTEEQKGIWVG
ncbi:MAG TPA: hypothetical protein VEQ41_02400 [Solirubrobacterales bacterium]|nr:hypothetical protein [Solirubrobacterales bacterium]